jgi:phospholipid transport system substrate-binding protein
MAKASAMLTVTVASLLAMSVPAFAGAPLDRVQSAVATVIGIVTRPDLKGPSQVVTRRAMLRNAADSFFDFREMANGALGYHRAIPSESESAEFLALFTELLERCYLTSIENYAGERVIYLSETVTDDYATVRSKIVTTRGAEISLDYRLRKSSAGWFAVDVALENISLVANYRQQINRVLRTTSFATLLERMRAGQISPLVLPRGAGKPR